MFLKCQKRGKEKATTLIKDCSFQNQFLFCSLFLFGYPYIMIPLDFVLRKGRIKYEIYVLPPSSEKWSISERRGQKRCEENGIPGVSKIGYMWLIPKDAEKPDNGRRKSNRQQTKTEIFPDEHY